MSTRTADDGAPRRASPARLAVQLLIGAVVLLALWRLRDVVLISFAAIVAAERPSVTLALGSLRDRGLVERDADHVWLLHGGPPVELEAALQAS